VFYVSGCRLLQLFKKEESVKEKKGSDEESWQMADIGSLYPSCRY